MQSVSVNVLDILEALRLPEGLRLKDWTESHPEGFRIAEKIGAKWTSDQFFTTQIIGLERISDGKVASFEITGLKDGQQQPRTVRLFELAHALDQAIANLEKEGLKVNVNSISKKAGINRKTVQKYFK